MTTTETLPAPPAGRDLAEPEGAPGAPQAGGNLESDGLVVEELLVEEISIDGMCGVY